MQLNGSCCLAAWPVASGQCHTARPVLRRLPPLSVSQMPPPGPGPFLDVQVRAVNTIKRAFKQFKLLQLRAHVAVKQRVRGVEARTLSGGWDGRC